MDRAIDFFKNLNKEQLIELLKNKYVLVFITMFIVLIVVFIITCVTIRTKKIKKIITYEDNNVRFFSIHYDKDYVYSVDKRNLSNKRKENLEWFYNCFSPQERVRVMVWLGELQKEEHSVPHHIEVVTKVKNVKTPVFTVIDVSSINYEKKIIHLESRLFPSIHKEKKSKSFKSYIVHYSKIQKLLLENDENPRTLFLIRLSNLESVEKTNPNDNVNFTLYTLIVSRLVKFLSSTRYLCNLKSNEIALIDFKFRKKDEAIAFGHTLAKVLKKTIGLSSVNSSYSFRIGINQERKQDSDFFTLTRFAREVAIYAEKQNIINEVIIYDQNSIKSQENIDQIIYDIKNCISKKTFSCKYTPIINAQSGKSFGYVCELTAPNSLVYSVPSMLDYAYDKGFVKDLLKVLYLETNQAYLSREYFATSTQFLTMKIDLAYYQDIIDIFAKVSRPKNVNTIFILEDKKLEDIDIKEILNILELLKKGKLTIGLEINSTTLTLIPEILKQFDYFIINGDSFNQVQESKNLIFFSDMISRLNSYKGTLIASNLSSWTLIELFANLNIKHISSPLFGSYEKGLPNIENKKLSKLQNLYNPKKLL